MQRANWLVSVVGVVLASSAVLAEVPKEVTLFGQKYNVTAQNRAGVFKNGVKIQVQTIIDEIDTRQKANLSFVEGADRAADRLYVVAPIGGDTEGPLSDGFYQLTGTDENGRFTPAASDATQFFGGYVNNLTAGRGQTIAWLSDIDTGKQKDRNFAMVTFTGADRVHFFDRDTLGGIFEEVFSFVLGIGEDENMPLGSWLAMTAAPNGYMVSAADSGGTWEMGLMDPTKDTFFNIKTDLAEATKGSAKALEHTDTRVHALARYGPDEYWILSSIGDPGGNNDEAGGEQYLTRLKVTFPDKTDAGPNTIKAEVVGQEEIFAKNLHGSPGGMFGMAIGRELPAGSGKRVIYLADWVGSLVTLTPQ